MATTIDVLQRSYLGLHFEPDSRLTLRCLTIWAASALPFLIDAGSKIDELSDDRPPTQLDTP